MRLIKTILYTVIFLFLLQNCKHTEQTGRTKQAGTIVQGKLPLCILDKPINSSDEKTLLSKDYSRLQLKTAQYKENGAIIESLDGGKRERLWFASSHPDSTYMKYKLTNHFQQIYYTERSVDGGKCMNTGWGDIKKFEIEVDNSLSPPIANLFNKATKGSPTIAGNTMIIACDNIIGGDENQSFLDENKDLWQLSKTGEKWGTPKKLATLSNIKTWDSQPALSPDGKHLFFVSNRLVNDIDKSVDNSHTGKQLHIFYSFLEGDAWREPVLVKELLTSDIRTNNITPSVGPDSHILYFSSNREGGKNKIYQVPLELLKNGGYEVKSGELTEIKNPLYCQCGDSPQAINLNLDYNAVYPLVYRNKLNKTVPQAFLWSSDNPDGFGGFDIYACEMPLKIDYNVILVEKSDIKLPGRILLPVIELKGAASSIVNQPTARFDLYSGLKYQIKGGSNAYRGNTDYCNLDDKYIFIGYSILKKNASISDRNANSAVVRGAEVNSVLTDRLAYISFKNLVKDTIVNDTIYITKAWELKKPCLKIPVYIPPRHDQVAYFQTGFWEVNTTANLKRDLARLHEGYEIPGSKDIYNPTTQGIKIVKSDYRVPGENLMFQIDLNDSRPYSIADARWIELHPNNMNWGDRPDYVRTLSGRMNGRKERIVQYINYAKQVDENLETIIDTIKTEYFGFLEKHMDNKPQLLIEIFAVSDQREVNRGWYIGDTISYRGSSYEDNKFPTEIVKIVPPKLDEKRKTVLEIKECSIGLNAQGDNGTRLGILRSQTDHNTNLSKLRAWFGYKEVFNRLMSNEFFSSNVKMGKVALPDNKIDYKKADIIVITQGKRIDVINPKNPYPDVNNPSGDGYFDYDQVRRIEIRVRFLYPTDKNILKTYCCDPIAGSVNTNK
jgi:hypothetical protein